MAEHTKGPWTWTERKGERIELRAPSVTSSDIPEYVLRPEVEVTGYGASVTMWIEVSDANARLIAAAPDLLEVLTDTRGGMLELVGLLFGEGWATTAAAVVEQIRCIDAAIAKATGAKAEGK